MDRRASRLSPHRACLVGLAALVGCDAVVVLGSECRPLGSVCGAPEGDALPSTHGEGGVGKGQDPVANDGGVVDGASDVFDGGVDDDAGPSSQDGGDPADAVVDGAVQDGASGVPALPLDVSNPSFELQSGSPGDFGASLLSTTDISPWYECQAVGLSFLRVEEEVNVGTTSNPIPVRATEGANFLAFQYPYVADLPVPVYQELSTPLKAGQPYAFMIDVRTEGAGANNNLALAVRGTNVRCDQAAVPLANTPYLQSGGWEEVCIRFTPATDLQHIAFLPVVRGIIAVTFRMFLDNIREDPRCQ